MTTLKTIILTVLACILIVSLSINYMFYIGYITCNNNIQDDFVTAAAQIKPTAKHK